MYGKPKVTNSPEVLPPPPIFQTYEYQQQHTKEISG